jgi:hypothetical protein
MLRNGTFWVGVIAGMAALWAYHAFVKPVPSTKTS